MEWRYADGELWCTDEERCFVPTCAKMRKYHPDRIFLSVPSQCKEAWCQILGRNCPKRRLLICDQHLDTNTDCFNTKSGKLKIKTSATLRNIQQTNVQAKENVQPSTSSVTHTQEICYNMKVNVATQYSGPGKRNKGILAKPSVCSTATNTSFKVTAVEKTPTPSDPTESDTKSTPTSEVISSYEPSATIVSSCQTPVVSYPNRDQTLQLIKMKSKMYIGVPAKYYWLIKYLANKYQISELHILITLFKIKLNDSVDRISDHFDLSNAAIKTIFNKTVRVLATFAQNLIFLPTPLQIKKNLPPVFKIRYSNVQMILDCFEIEIEKPSDPLKQAQTWSNYKSCNTVKYLVGCLPNGFVCFISEGYGGRTSDKEITEKSGIIDVLPPNSVVMADRGFKGVETFLNKKNIKLLRPPSVFSGSKLSKQQVIETKVIASLRVHVERVIRRLREFKILKPHSVVNHKYIHLLDEIVIIVCGLINLQNEIIKTK